jgi:hypothetical protein
MKIKVVFFFLLFGLFSYANEDLNEEGHYQIVSENKVDDVPEGFCRVRGKLYVDGIAIQLGSIYNFDASLIALVDSLGNYSIVIPTSNTLLYFYAPNAHEIIVENHIFKSGYELVIDFYSTRRLYDHPAEKPVIYLYSNQPTNVNLSIDFKGDLTFMYPRYDNGWQVNVSKKGILNTSDQKIYPYLFWEGVSSELGFVTTSTGMEGYFIQTDSTISFLENTLTQLGLNQTEMTDFITFWGPQIKKHQYATIQFLVDEEYTNEVAGINVNPAPDAMRRIYLLFEGSEIELKQNFLTSPVLKPFVRKGFTLVEWGGTALN